MILFQKDRDRLITKYNLQLRATNAREINHEFDVYFDSSRRYAGCIQRDKSKDENSKMYLVRCKYETKQVNNLLEALEFIDETYYSAGK